MNSGKRVLSISLVTLILFGLLGSTLHVHDNAIDLSQTNQEKIAQDHHFCALCASQIQYDVAGTNEVTPFFRHYIEHFELSESVIPDRLFSIRNYRAPPISS